MLRGSTVGGAKTPERKPNPVSGPGGTPPRRRVSSHFAELGKGWKRRGGLSACPRFQERRKGEGNTVLLPGVVMHASIEPSRPLLN